MTVTALQPLRIEGVEVLLGRIDISPLAGGEPGKKTRAIIEKVSITFETGMVEENLLPGYWTICECESDPPEHPRLSLEGGGRYRFDTFDFEPGELPLEIPGLLIIER